MKAKNIFISLITPNPLKGANAALNCGYTWCGQVPFRGFRGKERLANNTNNSK